MYTAVVVLVYFITIKLKFMKFNKYYFFIGVNYILIFYQPAVIAALFNGMACRTITDKKYITGDINYQCNTV
jgi:hypothetical protein